MNTQTILKAKELLDKQKQAEAAKTLALLTECEFQFADCHVALHELKSMLKLENLEIGGNGFSYKPHQSLHARVKYLITILDGKVAYCRQYSGATTIYFPSKEAFFNEITQLLAANLND